MPPSSSTDEFATIPPKSAELEDTWKYLQKGVDHFINKHETGLSYVGYTNLYTTVYNYCTSTKIHGRIDGSRSKSRSSPLFWVLLTRIFEAGANLMGADLYKKLSEYFVLHFKGLLEVCYSAYLHLHKN